jgi:hypothetical protein
MTSLKLSMKLITHRNLTFIRTTTAEILIKSKGVKTMFFPNFRQTKLFMVVEQLREESTVLLMNKPIPRLNSTIRENTMGGTNGKLVQNHLEPILEITRRLVSTEGETGTRNMHIRNIPRNSAIGKPKTRTRREVRMATRMPAKRKEEISITRTRQRIPFCKEVPKDRMVNSTGRRK